MGRKPAAFLVLLTMLAFAGQLVAAPFLDCPMDAHQAQDLEQEHSQHHGTMAAHHGHGMEKPEAFHSMNEAGHHDCDGWCAQCSGNCSAIVPRQEFLSAAPDYLYVPAQRSLLPPSRLSDLFKPPILV